MELIVNDMRRRVYGTQVMRDLKSIYSFEKHGWQKNWRNSEKAFSAYCETALANCITLSKSKLINIFGSALGEDKIDHHIILMLMQGKNVIVQ